MPNTCLFGYLIINSIKIFLLERVSQVRTCSGFPISILKVKEKMQALPIKLFWMGKKSGKINHIESRTEYASVEGPLNMHRTASNKTTLISEIPNVINEQNVIIAPGQGQIPVLMLSDEFCEDQALPYLLPKGNFGHIASRDLPVSPAEAGTLALGLQLY